MSGGMALRLYTALWRLALPLVLARLYWRGRTQPAYRQRIGERLVRGGRREGEGNFERQGPTSGSTLSQSARSRRPNP
ncbi:MAG: hypothetical protein MZV65_50045 [Chromatiales bacterium]|nr:hypothetical protein [Chromatiales bacterium]